MCCTCVWLGLSSEMKRKNEQSKVLAQPATHTHTHKRTRIQVLFFFFLLNIFSDLLTLIKWSAWAEASVNRDLDLVEESIRLQQYTRSRISILFIYSLNYFFAARVQTVAVTVTVVALTHRSFHTRAHTHTHSFQSEFLLYRANSVISKTFTHRNLSSQLTVYEYHFVYVLFFYVESE